MTEDAEIDVMSAMMKGKITVSEPDLIKVEIGDGKGLGSRYGTYKQYMANLATQGKTIESYIGKNLTENESTISIEESQSFNEGEDIICLMKYNNLLYGVRIKLKWMGADLEYYSGYEIPAPMNMRYNWWETYYTWFYAPPDLRSGEYMVQIESTELKVESKQGGSRPRYLQDLYFEVY